MPRIHLIQAMLEFVKATELDPSDARAHAELALAAEEDGSTPSLEVSLPACLPARPPVWLTYMCTLSSRTEVGIGIKFQV